MDSGQQKSMTEMVAGGYSPHFKTERHLVKEGDYIATPMMGLNGI